MMDEYKPRLTLSPDLNLNAVPEVVDAALPVISPEEAALSPEELATVETFSKQINIEDTNAVLQFGAAAQKNIADFSSTSLEKVKSRDMGEVGDMISGLVVELKGFDAGEQERKGLSGLFRRGLRSLETLKARYEKVEVNVDRISGSLENKQVELMKDIAVLDKLYDMNLAYFKELSMYILAGRKKLREVQQTELPAAQEKASRSGLPEDAQAASDLADKCDRFDKKLHDLELTRIVSIQMAPQIRLLQNNDSLMVEKIQSSIVNTIPLWKTQMVLALGLQHSKEAMEAERAVTDMTNELLRKNAEALRQGTVDIARESQRGVVDVETLRETNQKLIATLDEVKQIQDEGVQKRREAQVELSRIEAELKSKLLEFKR